MKKTLPKNLQLVLLNTSSLKAVIDLFHEVLNCSQFPVGSHWSDSQFNSELNQNRMYGLVSQNQELIACAAVNLIGNEVEVQQVIVSPTYWGKGVGYLLLDQLWQHFINQNFILEVHEQNLPAKELYLKFGFKIEGLRRHYYRDGGHALVMRKERGSA